MILIKKILGGSSIKSSDSKQTQTQEAVPTETSQSVQRMAICHTCEFRHELPRDDIQCTKCMCIMSLKTRIPFFHCPVGKW